MALTSCTQTISSISYDNIKEMVIVRDFEKHKCNLPDYGAGNIDTVGNYFITNQIHHLKMLAKLVSSVSSTS